ncbi:MBL fold metallo-hydrolase [Candidatus Vampirococcus lugosii]|uniref:Exonuclease n=1 Tax=Candidatus Vampirococcus lugosii TaxID=2789015 RepID=A0ABS5QM89_9BACT|nr:exonuclease [Candidatus Vampirococcus lugosii]
MENSGDLVEQSSGQEQEVLGKLKSVIVQTLGGVGDDEGNNLTGSSTRVRIKRIGQKDLDILIDLGMYQGGNEEKVIQSNKELPVNPNKIDAVILTHAHLDHIGRIPMLVNNLQSIFKGPIYATKVTSMLTLISLQDSAKIMKENLETTESRASRLKSFLNTQLGELNSFLSAQNNRSTRNRSNYSKIKEIRQKFTKEELEQKIEEIRDLLKEYGVEKNSDIANVYRGKLDNAKDKLLYNEEDVLKAYSLIKQTEFYQKVEILPGVKLMFFNAGHIMGAGQVFLEIDKGNGQTFNMGFSGDVGRFFDETYIGKPDVPDKNFDFYQIESTYGNREHSDKQMEDQKMIDEINKIKKRGGKILIPCFMIQRIQDISIKLLELMDKGKIPKMQIYYDGLYTEKINNIYRLSDNPNYKNLGNNLLVPINNDEVPNEFVKTKKTCIMLAPSGMMHGGSIQKYIKPILADKKNSLFFVGYQAEGTNGRKILDGLRSFDLPGVGYVDIKSEIQVFRSFSGHGDKNDLRYLMLELGLKRNSKVLVNHGDQVAQEKLVETLKGDGFDVQGANVGDIYKLY